MRNSQEPGDEFYTQYTRITTEPVGVTIIKKGHLYTKSSDSNQLIVPTEEGFIHGCYQATESKDGKMRKDGVRCYGPGSRIGIKAKDAGMHAGQTVKYNVATGDVSVCTESTNFANRVGRIFEIHTHPDIGEEKDMTDAGDIVVVDMV